VHKALGELIAGRWLVSICPSCGERHSLPATSSGPLLAPCGAALDLREATVPEQYELDALATGPFARRREGLARLIQRRKDGIQ
jgi:hypothetical protein